MYIVDITTVVSLGKRLKNRNLSELSEILGEAVIVDANEAAVTQGGVGNKEELFLPITRFFGERTDEFKQSIINAILLGEQTFEGELETRSLSGDKKYQLVKYVLIQGNKNRGFAMVSLIDISREKVSQLALAESEEWYRRLTENATDMIYRMKLPEGIYEYISPGSLSTMGYTPDFFYEYPTRIREILHPDWLNYFETKWGELLKGEMPKFYAYQIIDPQGKIRWMHQRNVLVRNRDGTPQAIEGIVTDITLIKEGQEKLAKSVEEKDFLLQEVHHRVKNNLSLISSIIDIQKQYCVEAVDREMFDQLQTRINTIGAIHGMLYESEDLRRAPTGTYIEELTELLKSIVSVDPDHIRIERNIENTYMEIAHLIPVGIILTELVTNSVKHAAAEEETLIITIDLKVHTESLELSYRDNGIGLPVQPIIEKPEHLGFDIIRGMTKKMGGNFFIEPGSRFRIEIPY